MKVVKIYRFVNLIKSKKGGGLTLKLLFTISLLTVSIAAAFPSVKELINNCNEEICKYNRQIILRSYYNYKIIDSDLTISEMLHAPEGKYFINLPSCPSGGKLYTEFNSENENLKCEIHNDN